MSYPILQSSTQAALVFLMVDSTDHITGKTGLTPTVTISKNGGTFASPSGAVTEISGGWYKVAGNATDTNTLGPLALHATATGADPTDVVVGHVVAYDPQSALATPTNITAGTITTATNLTNLPSIPNNWLTAAGIAASALNGKGDWNIGKTGYSLTQAFPTNFATLAIDANGDVTVVTNNDKTGYALAATQSVNVSQINGVTILGDGSATPFHV